MAYFRMFAGPALAAALLILPGVKAGAVNVSPSVHSRIDSLSAIELVQNKPKPETVTHRVKRIWRNLTGYKFDVSCPILPFVVTRSVCTATGKNREDARSKCQSRHMFCQITDANR